MKIVINIAGVKYGGSLTDSYNIIKELARLGKKDTYYIFISRRGKRELPRTLSNFHMLTFPLAEDSWLIHFIFAQIFLPLFIFVHKIDVLLSFNFASFLAPCPQIIRIIQPVCFSPIMSKLINSQGLRYIAHMCIHKYLVLLSIKKAERVIFVSEALKNDIIRFLSFDAGKRNKYLVSYIGVGHAFLENIDKKHNLSDSSGAIRILYPSFYYFHKNFPVLIAGMARLREKGVVNFELLLTVAQQDIPKKERSAFATIIDEYNLEQNIKFMGSVVYAAMPGIYSQADMVVFPSFAEAFPNPLPEAMSLGLPILASDIPVHREICQDAAVYFRVFSPEDLADKIILLLNNSDLRKQLSINGLKRAWELSWQDHVRMIYNVMEEIRSYG